MPQGATSGENTTAHIASDVAGAVADVASDVAESWPNIATDIGRSLSDVASDVGQSRSGELKASSTSVSDVAGASAMSQPMCGSAPPHR